MIIQNKNKRMLGEVLSFISVSFLLIFMQGCKPSLPSDILSRGEMEDVMYDYHLSKSLASQQGILENGSVFMRMRFFANMGLHRSSLTVR